MNQRVPIGGSRFAYGPAPGGFGARFYADERGRVTGRIAIDRAKEGPPGHAHGGALVAILDEAMGAASWYNGHRVLAVNLNSDLKHPVPLDVEIVVFGWVERIEGRKVFTAGTITLPDGMIAVSGRGIFVEAPQYLGMDGFNPFRPMSER
jgi:acyl-coenzyme A thioesterase PaaI-like protein